MLDLAENDPFGVVGGGGLGELGCLWDILAAVSEASWLSSLRLPLSAVVSERDRLEMALVIDMCSA